MTTASMEWRHNQSTTIRYRLQALNESALLVYIGESIDEATAEVVSLVAIALQDHLGELIIDLVPSYTSILINYDCDQLDSLAITHRVIQLIDSLQYQPLSTGHDSKVIQLPVYYGTEVALDAAELCAMHQLSFEQIVELHTSRCYRVYAIGFSPGFAYLGNLDARIASPRKATPRLKVPAGSVGLADSQTAIYPLTSPGGWQIIGRSPAKMIDWHANPPTPVAVGDFVQFVSIGRDEFLALGGQLDGV